MSDTMDAWLFDLGNTRLKAAPLRADGRLGPVLALPWQDGIEAGLSEHLPARFEAAYVASVAGEPVRLALLDALTRRARRISLARTQAAALGVRVAYAQPQRLGVDRFLALAAARARGGDALVCGVGTALTLDLLDADGRHHGGCIAPSP
ncbi:MAG TPA: type III pantothenate kinase, partial [Lysobacter sp.]|nr:type III pantothenate kinase [Lysobacter sp.]